MAPHKEIIVPGALKKGDKIAIIAPASTVKEEYVYGALAHIEERGFEAILMPHVLNHTQGTYASAREGRIMDLRNALEDRTIRAILCARGGYGCVHLLPDFSSGMLVQNPKWIIGFSDVSALLALWYRSGIASIHGPMAKHIALEGADNACTNALFNIMESGGRFDYQFPSEISNRYGEATGILRGGNMAVLNGLAATPYDMFEIKDGEDVILFFEDISEPIYAIERMLWRLYLSGTLKSVKGLIFGQFTEYKPDKNFERMEGMLSYWFERLKLPPIPIVFNFPIGHVSVNYPLVVGAKVRLEVDSESVSIRTVAG